MRMCQQCGLSIGDTAAFCPICDASAPPQSASLAAEPVPAQTTSCALCGHPGPLVHVETFLLCGACRGTLDLLTDRDVPSGISITAIDTEDEVWRSKARTIDAVYSASLDGECCETCAAMRQILMRPPCGARIRVARVPGSATACRSTR
jgi:hypothetical protein